MLRNFLNRPTVYTPLWDVKVVHTLTKLNYKVVGQMSKDVDVVLLTDGPPPSPFLYGEKKRSELVCDLTRDRYEMSLLRTLPSSIPKIGLGRGAHLLNIFNGGSAWQLVDSHVGGTVHKVVDMEDGTEQWVTSDHQQGMITGDEDVCSVLALSLHPSSTYKTDSYELKASELKSDIPVDIESCFYPYSNSLCYQPSDLSHEPTLRMLMKHAHNNITLKCDKTFEM